MPKVPETLHSRPPLERMHRIFHLLKDGAFPNCVKLAAEFEVSTRTIKRDIDFMKVRYQLPIEYDGRNYGYGQLRSSSLNWGQDHAEPNVEVGGRRVAPVAER